MPMKASQMQGIYAYESFTNLQGIYAYELQGRQLDVQEEVGHLAARRAGVLRHNVGEWPQHQGDLDVHHGSSYGSLGEVGDICVLYVLNKD